MFSHVMCFAVAMTVAAGAVAQEPVKEPRRRTDDQMVFAYTPKEDEGLLTQADLAALGCPVGKASGLYADIPLRGIRQFRLSTEKGCVADVSSTITELRYAKDDGPGLWKKIDKQIASRAKKCKGEPEVRPGMAGEKSRITLLVGTGKKCGFDYTVEAKGFIYQVSSYGGQLTVTPELEKLIAGKLDALAEGTAGAYDRAK